MTELKKELTLTGLVMIAIGSCIGSGIFLTPAKIASALPSPTLIILVWIIGGLVALTGALTFAELGSRFPKSGGVYVFLKEAYGDMAAFLYGWVILLVITSGAIAALGMSFAYYFDAVFHVGERGIIIVGIAAIILATIVNVLGVKIGEFFSTFFTVTKLIGIAIIILIGLVVAAPEAGNISFEFPTLIESKKLTGAFAVALIGVLWSYGGWHHASYLAGEAKNPQRNVPKAMVIGATVVTITYVLANLAYLYLLPISDIQHSEAVASDAISRVFSSGGFIIAVLIAISTLGTIGIYTMSAPRIYFTMAKDKLFFKRLAKIHPKYKTPTNAILLQSGWAIFLLLFWQTFNNLITYVVFMDWIFMTLAAIAIFKFRKRDKDKNTKLYKTWGYPITPLIFIGISTWFLIYTLIEEPIQTWAGLILLSIGLPVYFYFKKNKT